ncbi:MAG: anti-sigma factor [Betaproteobacteria bacterium]|nr:MAG: anti-sigma factor [Betaproteobacteria bacterium]
MSNLSETDLHAYVDGQLDDARRVQVEAHLAHDAAATERVHLWRAQNEALRAIYNAVLNEPVPQRLVAARPSRGRWPQYALAAGVVGLAFGLGWMSHAYRSDRFAEAMALPRRAAVAYAVYAPEVRHPVEVGAEQQDHLVKWLSKRLGNELKVPLLTQQGFDLVGGRLLPDTKGPGAQLMYQDKKGQRITLYVSLRSAEPRDTAFRFSQEGEVAVFYWIDGKLGYALSGEMDRASLLAVASVVYRQLNP